MLRKKAVITYTYELLKTKKKGLWLVLFLINWECDKALERVDFMDSIEEDSVKKSWSIQTDESGA